MASNPERLPGDVPENSRPLTASTSTSERAALTIHELSSTVRSSTIYTSATRIADEYPPSLIVPRARNRPSTNETTRTELFTELSVPLIELSLTSQFFKLIGRHTSRVRFPDNLDETTSGSRPTVGANYGSRVRRMRDSNGRDPDRDYTPTLYDPLPAVAARNHPNTSDPSSVYVPRRSRPFPLVTARDAPDTGRVYNQRREIYRPRVRATTLNFGNPLPFLLTTTWIQTQRQRPNARPVNCPFCRGPINRIVDRDGNIIEYQRNNVPAVVAGAQGRLSRLLGGAVANVADSTPRASSTMGGANAFDEFRRTLNRVGPAGNISEQVARARERLDDADADSSRTANATDVTNGAYGWWVEL
ncbi:uncharacterized protein EAF02_009472 [Botrytis sinoallii]|uniref:uncharacterized protein n=1 Tax=Botrytis sinoallii TaxID=1463999 RepID=UPI0019015511|nr:uncharacterized protein EAF02_009472 [Botrytis sinoallii]KAF7868736.1 hypothetical protein EAF02_009472 [Botrytis sinoallii]